MKNYLLTTLSLFCLTGASWAQNYNPIATTGYSLDGIAENTPASSTTSGPVDGSDYVLYSVAYGALYTGNVTGLPNNGVVATGSRVYQLQPYTQNNVFFLMSQAIDTLNFVTPASYPTISLLAFATEGSGSMDITVRFTDNSTQQFSNLTLSDWFSPTSNTVITGYDRATRTSGNPAYIGGNNNPQMNYLDLNLTCTNSSKSIKHLIIHNTDNNARICIMAVSGGQLPVYLPTTTPVTCSGGNNGMAMMSISGGVPPFSVSWNTNPVQIGDTVGLMPVGVTNYTVTDASSCTYTSFVTVSQALAPTPPLTITATTTLSCPGAPVTLSTFGAATYTWSNSGSNDTTIVSPTVNSNFSVVATTSANCTVTGSITITAYPISPLTFTSIPAHLCNTTTGGIPLTASPSGGTFYGNGLQFNSFFPSIAGVGTQTIGYTYVDANGCNTSSVITTVVSSPTTVIAFSVTPSALCNNSPTIALSATPSGGVFSGTGVTGSVYTPSLAGLGTRTVTYVYTDANNCTAKKLSFVTISLCTATGINELTNSVTFDLYPNPNTGSFHIKASADVKLGLVNELGQTIQTLSLDQFNNYTASVENLPSGIYFLKAQDQVIKQKIVVMQH